MKNYIGIPMLSILIACSHAPNKKGLATDSNAKTDTLVAVSDVQLNDPRLEKIYKGYMGLKNSLVASNAEAAHQTAMDLSTALKGFEGCENTGLIADKIAGSEDLKLQRREFTALSSDVIALFKHADLKKGIIYIDHCPMANNGDGADWLSAEKKIRNPYYGSKMMECGAVVEEIKPKQ